MKLPLSAMVTAAGLVAAAVVTGFGAARTAEAPSDGVQVGLSGRNDTADFSPALYITVAGPPGYRRVSFDGDSGDWRGPPIMQDGRASGIDSSISWGVGFRKDVRSAGQAARAALIQNYPQRRAAAIQIPHLVAGRKVGTVVGALVVTQAGARVEAAVGFPLGRGVFVAAPFAALFPDSDNVPPNQMHVQDVLASAWNREQVQAALVGIRIEGSLPPARVTAHASAEGRLVIGSVVDSFGHPVAGASVRLQSAGKAVHGGSGAARRTDGAGRFSLRVAGRRGSYRVVASLRRASPYAPPVTAVSAAIAAGR